MFDTKDKMIEFFYGKLDDGSEVALKDFKGNNYKGKIYAVGNAKVSIKQDNVLINLRIDDIAEVEG